MSKLRIKKELTDEGNYQVTATITEGPLPKDVFLYEYDSGELKQYIGVANLQEMTSRPQYHPDLEDFGVPFVRYDEAKKVVSSKEEADSVASHILKSVQSLSTQFENYDPEVSIHEV